MNTKSIKKVLRFRQSAVTLAYSHHRSKPTRETLNARVEQALFEMSDDEALAIVGATVLCRVEVPDVLGNLAEAILLSRRLSLRCLGAFLTMGKLEGEKLITQKAESR